MTDSPIDAGGRDTVGLVVAPNQLFLYTVNNFDSNVVEFAIGTDGKLYPQNTYNITGSLPTAAAIDRGGQVPVCHLHLPEQSAEPGYHGTELYTPANPGPGGITIFPINADNTLGAPVQTVNVGRNPMGIYASRPQAGTTCTSSSRIRRARPICWASRRTPHTGMLTPLPGVTINPGNVPSTGFTSGPNPAGILATRSRFSTRTAVSFTSPTRPMANIATYSVANGIPSLVATTPTDAGPMGMAFDPSGKFLYVAAYTANAIDGFTLAANGVPVRSTVAGSVQAGTGPTCVSISGAPSNTNTSHAVYLYTSNALSNNLTGEQLNTQNGSLEQIQGSPVWRQRSAHLRGHRAGFSAAQLLEFLVEA